MYVYTYTYIYKYIYLFIYRTFKQSVRSRTTSLKLVRESLNRSQAAALPFGYLREPQDGFSGASAQCPGGRHGSHLFDAFQPARAGGTTDGTSARATQRCAVGMQDPHSLKPARTLKIEQHARPAAPVGAAAAMGLPISK